MESKENLIKPKFMMKRIALLFFLLMLLPVVAHAQRIQVVTVGLPTPKVLTTSISPTWHSSLWMSK